MSQSYDKYIKYKTKYLQLLFQKGGTLGGLIPDFNEADRLKIANMLGYDVVEYIFKGFKMNEHIDFNMTLINILTNNKFNNIIVDSAFLYYVIAETHIKFSIDLQKICTSFFDMLGSVLVNNKQKLYLLFDDTFAEQEPFQTTNKRKSLCLRIFREFDGILNLSSRSVDMRLKYIPMIKGIIIEYFNTNKFNQNLVTNIIPDQHFLLENHTINIPVVGEGDELVFLVGNTINEHAPNENNVIVTVDGDLVVSGVIRHGSGEKNKDIIVIRPSLFQLNHFYAITFQDKQPNAYAIITSMLYTSTDAGYGKKLEFGSVNHIVELHPKKELVFNNFHNIMRKFIATLSILHNAWGISKEVLIKFLRPLFSGDEIIALMLQNFDEYVDKRFLFSVFPFSSADVAAFMQYLSRVTTVTEFIEDMNTLLHYEKITEEYYTELKKRNIFPAIFPILVAAQDLKYMNKLLYVLFDNENESSRSRLYNIIQKIFSKSGNPLENDAKIFDTYFKTTKDKQRIIDVSIKSYYLNVESMQFIQGIFTDTDLSFQPLNHSLNFTEFEPYAVYDKHIHRVIVCGANTSCQLKGDPSHNSLFRHIIPPSNISVKKQFMPKMKPPQESQHVHYVELLQPHNIICTSCATTDTQENVAATIIPQQTKTTDTQENVAATTIPPQTIEIPYFT